MNKAHLQVEKLILKQMEQENIPAIPRNRHQKRAAKKAVKRGA